MTAPFFLDEAAADLRAGQRHWLDGPEGHHAVAVKRLRPGEEIVLTDGAGAGVSGTVAETAGRDRLLVEITDTRREEPPRPCVTVVQALPKGDRGELAVELLTETGADAIVPWAASRCVARWKGDRAAKALARWRTTARESGKQARRLRFPRVADLATTDDVRALLAGADFAGVLHASGGASLAAADLPAAGEAVLVVGPEGGLTEDELATFAAAGATPYRLGPTVQRTSTAGSAATTVLHTRTGRWG